MSEEKRHGEELFSAMARAGSRTYFFDVLKAENGARYIKISESRRSKSEERHRRHRVMVFEEHLGGFIDALRSLPPSPRPASGTPCGPNPRGHVGPTQWSEAKVERHTTG